MTDAEQKELTALREFEKAVRADRDGCIYVADSRDPKTNRCVGQRWVRIEDVLSQLDRQVADHIGAIEAVSTPVADAIAGAAQVAEDVARRR